MIYIAVSKENRYNRVVERDKNFFEELNVKKKFESDSLTRLQKIIQ